MDGRRRGHLRGTDRPLAVGFALVLALGAVATAPAPPEAHAGSTLSGVTYRDFGYGPDGSRPSADKPQSKLWHHDGSWWALLLDPADSRVHVFELGADHVWRSTPAVVDTRARSTGDALRHGETVYVASRSPGSELRVARLSYDRATRRYAVDAGFPVAVVPGSSESASIERDTTGRLWVTYERGGRVRVVHSTTSDRQWSKPFSPPVAGTTVDRDDLSGIVAFDGRIGVLWSDQLTGAFRFAVHEDGAPADAWSLEVPLQGPGMADDHLNVKTVPGDPSGHVYAVVKTSQGDNGEPLDAPLVVVLVRSPDGTWTSSVAGTVRTKLSRPVLVLDESSRTLHVLATAPGGGGTVYVKSAPLGTAPSFVSGRGAPLVAWPSVRVGNATASRHPVSVATGTVVLASTAGTDRTYYHAESGTSGAATHGG